MIIRVRQLSIMAICPTQPGPYIRYSTLFSPLGPPASAAHLRLRVDQRDTQDCSSVHTQTHTHTYTRKDTHAQRQFYTPINKQRLASICSSCIAIINAYIIHPPHSPSIHWCLPRAQGLTHAPAKANRPRQTSRAGSYA